MCVHTELYQALSLKFMDIKMLQTTNSLNLKGLKIMGFTVSVSESDEAFKGYYDSLQGKISPITVLDELLAGMLILHTHLCLSIMN